MVAEELDVLERVGPLDLQLDLGAMAVIADLWRAAQEARSQLERGVLRPQGLSWGGFSLLFLLWISGPTETRVAAASMSCTRPSVSSLCDTLQRDGLVRRCGDKADRRLVRVDLTARGRRMIEGVYPRFNAGESQLVSSLSRDECDQLTALLRRLRHGMRVTGSQEAV